jgi:PAS domain S-box-containing protein
MNANMKERAREIRVLTTKLANEGWDRLRGVRLAHVVSQVIDECKRIDWTEATGRALTLFEALGEFVREAPQGERLTHALSVASGLADILEIGRHAALVNRDILPAHPEQWRFVLVAGLSEISMDLDDALISLGFNVARARTVEEVVAAYRAERTILLASAIWLAEQGAGLALVLGTAAGAALASPLLVALSDSDDFRVQIKARKLGARLLLETPLDVSHLLAEMAGLAWTPRVPYRVLLVDDDTSVLEAHAGMLRAAGFNVLAMDDPVAARDFLNEFAPEACVLDVEMPACRGTDLSALLRRDKRFAHLPVIYLSAFADIQHQLDARNAGGEDYLVKPVDPRLLITAVMARARQFRMFEATYRQRRQAWQQLEHLRAAIDAHSIVSVATVDGTIIDANSKFCEISGYNREQVMGRNHRILKSGHHPPSFFVEMWQSISEGRIWQGEIKNRKKDGSDYWVQSTVVPILDEDGLPRQYISIRTEITEQKRILADRERHTRLLDLLREALQYFIGDQDLSTTSGLLLDGMLLLTNSAFGFIGEVLHNEEGAPYLKSHAISDIAWDESSRRMLEQARNTGMEFRQLNSLFGAVLRSGEAVIANDPAHDPRQGGLPEGHPRLDAFLGVPIHHGSKLIGMIGLANRPGGYDSATVDFLQAFTTTYAAILQAVKMRHYQKTAIEDLQRVRETAAQATDAQSEFLATWAHELHVPVNAILGHAQILQLHGTLDAETQQQVDEIAQGGKQLARLLHELKTRIDQRVETKRDTPLKPLESLPNAPKRLQQSHSSDLSRRRILVAEDNPANQAVLRMQLGVLGFEAEIAADGAAAMNKWQAEKYDLILADRNMPIMDGLELARAIRATERESGAHIPIIAITAVQHPEELAFCLQAGMDDTLPKPIELDDLRRMLERWLPQGSPVLPSQSAERQPEPTPRKTGATLDLDYLIHIVGNADLKSVRELVDLFTATARADLPACHQYIIEQKNRAIARVMHKLKSSARMVGALRFAGLSEMLESAAQSAQMEDAAMLLADLERALDDVEAAASRIAASSMPTLAEAGTIRLDGTLPRQVLVVDDDPVARRQIGMLLNGLGVVDVLSVEDADTALAQLARGDHMDLLISDLSMPGMDGVEFLRCLAENGYQGDLILSSGVEAQLLQSAAEFALGRGMSLRGTLQKPVTREALLSLLIHPFEKPAQRAATNGHNGLSPQDVLEGIRRNEFDVHFQPKVDAATLKAVGVEALARWQRHGKPVSPDLFITVAEQHGLIEQLSELLITKALIGGAQLQEAGFPLMVAVNVSANWLSDVRLPDFIMASVQATGFRAENLILEITETGVMADVTTALDVMSRLRLKGFKLSIDDFGTGYSSLEQLQRFPFGELKLDRSFVQGAAEKPAARAILASTLELAIKLKLSTVAEGVETQAELDLVRGLGCHLVQGWLIAKAMPLDTLIEWLRAKEVA